MTGNFIISQFSSFGDRIHCGVVHMFRQSNNNNNKIKINECGKPCALLQLDAASSTTAYGHRWYIISLFIINWLHFETGGRPLNYAIDKELLCERRERASEPQTRSDSILQSILARLNSITCCRYSTRRTRNSMSRFNNNGYAQCLRKAKENEEKKNNKQQFYKCADIVRIGNWLIGSIGRVDYQLRIT